MADTYMNVFPRNPMMPDPILTDTAPRDGLQFLPSYSAVKTMWGSDLPSTNILTSYAKATPF